MWTASLCIAAFPMKCSTVLREDGPREGLGPGDLHDSSFRSVRISCWSRDHIYIEAAFKPELLVKLPSNP
jgi:hypothetical protein